MSGIQYPVDIKDIGKFENQNNITVNVYGCEDKKIFPLRITTLTPLQEITWIYYISLLVKHLIMYWWKTWAGWYRDNIIMTKAKNISVNIVCTAAPVKRHWKTIWKDASYTGRKESDDKKGRDKIKFTQAEYQLRLPFVIYANLKAFYINKTCVSHRHQNPLPPNTSIT